MGKASENAIMRVDMDEPPAIPAKRQGRHYAADRLVLHVLELREQHGLRLIIESRPGADAGAAISRYL